MKKLNDCMQILGQVLRQNNLNGMEQAEAAIDKLLTDALPADRFLVISALKSAILKVTDNLPASFIGQIFDLIEDRERALGTGTPEATESSSSCRLAK